MSREVSQPIINAHGDEEHPAFGLIGAFRISGGDGVLFDSDIRHQHSIVVRVSTATRKRDLHHDWIHQKREFLEVQMSEAQWASFVSSMNSGSGTPCTIRHREDDYMIDAVPYQPRLAESLREVHEATAKTFGAIADALAAYQKVLDDTGGAAERRKALSWLHTTVDHTSGNLDFAAKSMAETAENVVQRAKADVEAFVTAQAVRLGLDPIELASPLELTSTEVIDEA